MWFIVGANKLNRAHQLLFHEFPDYIDTETWVVDKNVKAKKDDKVLYFRNYKNHHIDKAVAITADWNPNMKYYIELPFRQIYFCKRHIEGSHLVTTQTKPKVKPHVETWLYETIVSEKRFEEAAMKSRYLGPAHDSVNRVMQSYEPFPRPESISQDSKYAALLCTYDSLCMNRGWSMEDNQLRLYHACYHNYRHGNTMLKDECIARAMKELQLTFNFGQPTRHTVPDTYHHLWWPLSQAVVLRHFYHVQQQQSPQFQRDADDYIRDQCAMTHNHEDYLWMACEYSLMWINRDHIPHIPADKTGLRWVRFRQIVEHRLANSTDGDKEVQVLIHLLNRTFDAFPVRYHMDNLTRGHFLTSDKIKTTICQFDMNDHIWHFRSETDKQLTDEDIVGSAVTVHDLVVVHEASTSSMKIESVWNKNLQHIPLSQITVKYFQNRHMDVPRNLQDDPYDTKVTYKFEKSSVELHEYSVSMEGMMCGRHLIQVIQWLFQVPISSVDELNSCVQRHIQDHKSLGKLYAQSLSAEYVGRGFKKFYEQIDMLWNPIDLKIAMNEVGLEVGVVFYSPNIRAGQPEQKEVIFNEGQFSVYNFDKYYRPCYYERYILGVIRHNHWYFLTYGGSMIFTSELLQLLPPERTNYYSYGRETILYGLISEKSTQEQIYDSRKKGK